MSLGHKIIRIQDYITKPKQAKLALSCQPSKGGRPQVFQLAGLLLGGIIASVYQRTQTQSQVGVDRGTAVSCRLFLPGGGNREHLVRGVRTILTGSGR